MKNIFKSLLCCCALALCLAPMTGCSDKDDPAGSLKEGGISAINNPFENILVSKLGETATISFTADAAWDASIEPSVSGDWVSISGKSGNSAAGKGSVRLEFLSNSGDKRSVNVYVTVTGFKRILLCTLTQTAGSGTSPELNSTLNNYMNEQLKAKYLWNTSYKALADKGGVNLDGSYDDFLYTHLTKLGDVNIEDGGLYRAYSSLSGKRYIYSYITEINPGSRASSMTGLGIGPTLSMRIFDEPKKNIGLVIGYVYPSSPADKAGLRRGDTVYEVNDIELMPGNYSMYQNTLFRTTSGTFKIKYYRYEKDGDGMIMVSKSTTVSAASFGYSPVLTNALIKSEPGASPAYNVGYLVLESFDLSSHEYMKQALEQLKTENITDLILDLRFNYGGSVAEARYLASSIAGSAHNDDIFSKIVFNDNSSELWSFGYGNKDQSDGLGQGPDLGIKRLYVICSENTASASEMVINSLKGIDFPVYTYGSRTEGKNVGMVTSTFNYEGRKFEFAPIMFYTKNAKDFGGYADGFAVDHEVNNQNSDWTDDKDTFFPYLPTDWGSNRDIAFVWALLNCTTGEDPDFTPTAQSRKSTFTRRGSEILKNNQIQPAMGRFGSVIYGQEEEVTLK